MCTPSQLSIIRHYHQTHTVRQLAEMTGLKGSSVVALAFVHRWKITTEKTMAIPPELLKRRKHPVVVKEPRSRPPAEYSNARPYDQV